MEQEQLENIKKCIKRNRKAQYIFYKVHFDFFVNVCSRYAKSQEHSLELVNLGFAKVMLQLKEYDIKQPFEKWSKTILINTCIDEYRKSKRYKAHVQQVEDEKLPYINPASTQVSYNSDLQDAIDGELKTLPEMTRNVFTLYAVEGYKHQEISKMLHIPEGTSYYHLSAAKKALKSYLQNEFNINQ